MSAGDHVAHAHPSHCHIILPSWLAWSCLAAFLPFVYLFGFNLPDYLIVECWAPLPYLFVSVGPLPSSFVMPPHHTRHSFQRLLPVVFSLCLTSTITSSPTVVSAPAVVSGTSASALISPKFLALVIQAIQTTISAIVQQWLSAAVGTPSFSMQGLPAISVQGLLESSLVNHTADLDSFGMHQPWSSTITLASQSSTAVGSLPLNTLTTSTSPPVALQLNTLPGMSSILAVPPFVSVFSFASLLFSAPCLSTVYSLSTTVNSTFSSRPIVSHTVVPSLAALPLQQLFVVGPGYSPVPYKVASQITTGKFVNLEDLLAENIPPNEPKPQLWFDSRVGLVAHAQEA